MIELCALAYADPHRRIREGDATRWQESHVAAHQEFQRSYDLGNVYLLIKGARPVGEFGFDGPHLCLICHPDLLGAAHGAANPGKEATPAVLLAHLYEQEGDSFVTKLHGTFSIILYDKRTETLKAWTDHFGVRRLAFAASPESIAVATDLRRITQGSNSPPRIDPVALLEYLQYTCIPAPRTIYTGIQRLEPGHQLIFKTSPATRAYWDMTYPELKAPARSEHSWAKEVFEAINSAVTLNTDLPDDSGRLGCFLSGGTDSSSVTGLVGKITGQPPRSFSIGFDDPRYNEINYARIAAATYQSDHHEHFVTPQDILSLLERVTDAYDEPFGNASVIPAFYCARLAADNGITHMLAGDGGDELFGGNERYVKDIVFQRYSRVPRWLRHRAIEPAIRMAATKTSLGIFDRAARYIRRAEIPLPDRLLSYSFLSSIPLSELFTGDFLSTVTGYDPLARARAHYRASSAEDDLNRWLYLDVKMTLTDNDLVKVTGMAELAGVTPRFPLLDWALAEFSGTIPAELKVKGMELRYIFKKGMARILPMKIIRKRKHGFGLPYSVWVGEHMPLRDFTFDVLGASRCRQRGYFRTDLLESLWSNYTSVSKIYYGDALWIFLMLELWHATQHDVRSAPPVT